MRARVWAEVRERLRALFFRAREERELARELEHHIELEAEQRIREGMTPAEARRRAVLAFGGVERTKEEVRDARGTRWLEDLRADVGYAVRLLRKRPAFAAAAVLTFALGIGATTAIFGVVNAVLLRSLPFPDADRLVRLHTVFPVDLPFDLPEDPDLSPPNFMSLREESRALAVTMVLPREQTLTGVGEARTIETAEVGAAFFDVVGVAPALGRGFRPAENQPGGERVVVLGHGLWQRRFGGDRGVLGTTIRLDGIAHTVVGVMPAGFDYPDDRVLWTPLQYRSAFSATGVAGRAYNFWLPVIARLQPGVTLEEARVELRTLGRRLEAAFPATNEGVRFTAVPLHDDIVGEVRGPLLLLFGAVALVLFIACANVAGLLLARAATRGAEVAVRAALGAARGRLVRQFVTESLVLGLAGGTVALGLAFWATQSLVAVRPEGIPLLDSVGVDAPVLAFALGITLLVSLAAGLVPALRATEATRADALRVGGRGGLAPRRARRLRSGLVVGQVALAVVLLAGAGLLVRSFITLTRVDVGFRTERMLSFPVELPRTSYDGDAEVRSFFARLTARLEALPGVEAAAAVNQLPLVDGWQGSGFAVEGRPPLGPDEVGPVAGIRSVTPEYFLTMGLPLVRGRGITERDRAGSIPVVVINEAAAERFFPGVDPIGKRLVGFRYDPVADAADAFTIVGVIGNVRHFSLDRVPEPELYFPHAQAPIDEMAVVVRTAGDPLGLTGAIRRELQAIDPNLPAEFRTLEGVVADSVSRPRFLTTLLALFAGVALTLAAIGLFGLLSFDVAQQSREIGIRIALGARPGRVLGTIVRRALELVGLGLGLGIVGALALTRALHGMLYEVSPTDPLTFATVVLVLGGTAVLAGLIPARRAARVDPIVSLRAE